jgi:hypothetical protein
MLTTENDMNPAPTGHNRNDLSFYSGSSNNSSFHQLFPQNSLRVSQLGKQGKITSNELLETPLTQNNVNPLLLETSQQSII